MLKRFSFIGLVVVALLASFSFKENAKANTLPTGKSDSLYVDYDLLEGALTITGQITDLDSLKKYTSAPIDASMYNTKWSKVRVATLIDTGYGSPTNDSATIIVWHWFSDEMKGIPYDTFKVKNFQVFSITKISDTTAISHIYFTVQGVNGAKFNRRVQFIMLPQDMIFSSGYETARQRGIKFRPGKK